MGLLDLFKTKGVKRKEQRMQDFKAEGEGHRKGLFKGKWTERDRAMIAKGRNDVHKQNTSDYYYRKKKAKSAQKVTRAKPTKVGKIP